jgi:hypothetical protein
MRRAVRHDSGRIVLPSLENTSRGRFLVQGIMNAILVVVVVVRKKAVSAAF